MIGMARKQFTGRHLLIILIGFFGVVLAINGIFAYLAVSTYRGVDSSTAYQDGLHYNQRIEAAHRQAGLGLSHEVRLENGRVEVGVVDAKGWPVTGLSVSGQIARPVAEDAPRALVLKETRAGFYAASVDGLGPGNWILTLEAKKSLPLGEEALYRIEERLWLRPN
jgi:nitrogen fixation protein FixH